MEIIGEKRIITLSRRRRLLSVGSLSGDLCRRLEKHGCTITVDRQYQHEELLRELEAARLDWSAVTESDWDGVTVEAERRAQAWSFDADYWDNDAQESEKQLP